MPKKIIDPRVRQGKLNRNDDIRKYFAKYYNAGYRYEVIEEKIILKWGVSANTIYQIIKGYGNYKEHAPPQAKQLNLFENDEYL
ncbi:hypothetical protein [Dysgonomonas sp. 520]|uniref:hypothetical protein n=1 Tax=Dysgonomonas sp. 520 TaxID=2302931 RepID=UPI0013D2EC87|nr:hypothetical protein [Dysgonomonas sp. 520]NDW10473.1 hypothetical protein [Dysgonomonas sp. 520]